MKNHQIVRKKALEVTNLAEHSDPPGGGRCPQCGWAVQISRKNEKMYCTVCEKYKEDMEGTKDGHGQIYREMSSLRRRDDFRALLLS